MSVFSQVQLKKPRTNTFNLSHDRKMSVDFGRLYPSLVLETVPGDRINIVQSSCLAKLAPMIAPPMHRANIFQHFFFVPNRILWPNWNKFISGGEDGLAEPNPPQFQIGDGAERDRLADYLGAQLAVANGTNVSALPFAAYQRIWWEYFRDQNQLPDDGGPNAVKDLVDGDNEVNQSWLKALRTRSWSHDYFTSSLPWTQRGPEATIPLGEFADITFDRDAYGSTFTGAQIHSDTTFLDSTDNPLEVDGTVGQLEGPARIDLGQGTRSLFTLDNAANLRADLSTATAATITDLRRAFRLQEWLERNARGGGRINEVIMSHFGVKTSDARLQRPEYIGGYKTPITISEVLQTSSNANEPTPQANMAGHGVAAGGDGGYSYFCEEHGYIIGLVSILPTPSYQDGIARHFLKKDKFDYFWPSFESIGEQATLKMELYADSTDGENEETFGYLPRYSEYKFMPSTVHGKFRTNLDFWHMGRKFDSRPVLNNGFMLCTPDEISRIFAVTTSEDDQVYMMIYHNIKAQRRMRYFGNPSI